MLSKVELGEMYCGLEYDIDKGEQAQHIKQVMEQFMAFVDRIKKLPKDEILDFLLKECKTVERNLYTSNSFDVIYQRIEFTELNEDVFPGWVGKEVVDYGEQVRFYFYVTDDEIEGVEILATMTGAELELIAEYNMSLEEMYKKFGGIRNE